MRKGKWNRVDKRGDLEDLDSAGVGLGENIRKGTLEPGKAADIVVYDALVDERVLQLAKPGATLDYAGKRGGKPSPMQRDISLKLIALARAGQRVLRLKGGDPFVFGLGDGVVWMEVYVKSLDRKCVL